MRLDPSKKTNERGLIEALAHTGRLVRPADVANWRKNGLLPPLTAHGLGAAKGKAYCWHEKNIVARTAVVFDVMKNQGRADQAVVMLFLSGFDISLARFRRAWAAQMKSRRRQAARASAATVLARTNSVLEPILVAGASIQGEPLSPISVRAIEHGLARLGYFRQANVANLCRLMAVMTRALESMNLVQDAEDSEILRAQDLLDASLDFLDNGGGHRQQITASAGAAIFIFILAALRSGQDALLEHAMVRMKFGDRLVAKKPVPGFDGAVQTAAE